MRPLSILFVLVVALVAFWAGYLQRRETEFHRACEAAGGHVYSINRRRLACLRPGAEIHIRDDSK